MSAWEWVQLIAWWLWVAQGVPLAPGPGCERPEAVAVVPMTAPELRPDGTCSACKGGWLCEYHQQEVVQRFETLRRLFWEVRSGARAAALARVAAEHDYESDEMSTAEQKAENFLRRGPPHLVSDLSKYA